MNGDGDLKGELSGRKGTVLLLAPTANDARLTGAFLHDAGFPTQICADLAQMRERVDENCGCLVVAEEALRRESVRLLVEALEQQPSWSDIPVIIITSGGEVSRERLQRLALLGPAGNVSLLERPFRPATLVSTAAVALKARARQYQVRDLLLALGRARDEAEQASRAKDDFLAALSHELRTPLNPVLLLAAAGAENPRLPPKVREDFAVIRKNVNLEARLIDDLLDLTRIARGKLQMNSIFCDMHGILADAIQNVRGDAEEKGIRLTVDRQAVQPGVQGDPVRLQQVFWNVLKNAVKFAPTHSVVQVTTLRAPAGRVTVSIQDEGIGLSSRELEHIFDAFSQGNHDRLSDRNPSGGLGLGLAISRMLVELHEGSIWAESAGPGLGATFFITLPTVAHSSHEDGAPDQEPSVVPVVPAETPRRRILLVEDHEDTLAAMAFLLGLHFDVVTASSGKEARARAAEGPFDLVVSDIGLPDEKGYDLMTFLKTEHGLTGIALTGYGMEDDMALSEKAGFLAHLTKPVEFGVLEQTIREAFETAGVSP